MILLVIVLMTFITVLGIYIVRNFINSDVFMIEDYITLLQKRTLRQTTNQEFSSQSNTALTHTLLPGGESKGSINLRQAVKILENNLDKNKSNYIGIVTPDRTYEIIAEDENEHRFGFVYIILIEIINFQVIES